MVLLEISLAVAALAIPAFLIRTFLKWTITMCESKKTMKDKVVIVTGANTGIGFETAKDLAGRGAKVILACRNKEKAEEARKKIIEETGNRDIQFKHLNLSSLNSVRKFAEDIKSTERKIDVLVNNAGVYGLSASLTEDNIVEGMQINYFAQFLLTLLLLPLIKKCEGRIVNVNSIFLYIGTIKIDHLNKFGYYNNMYVYANSKLCSLAFTVELARRLKGTGVTVNACHPGVIYTGIHGNMAFITKVAFQVWCWLCCRTPMEGAQTVIYLSIADECANVSGKFLIDCKEMWFPWSGRNVMASQYLWDYTEKIVKYKYKDETDL